MTDPHHDLDLLERLVDEFTSRYRAGEFPPIAEFVARYPQHAARIEELCSGVAMMEQLRAGERCKREAIAQRSALSNPPQRIGDFAIIREIGRGGMGVVYEAEQQSLARRVAVKVLPKHLLSRDVDLQRFQREAQTAARLHHTNIVPVFGVGDQDGLHYYVMPLVQGVGLDEVIDALRTASITTSPDTDTQAASEFSRQDIHTIARRLTAGKFPALPLSTCVPEPGDYWRCVARVGIQAAAALAYAHSQGTLHRDIKPGNLVVDQNGVVYVADFGLASAVEQADGSRGEVVGTARYMAPEQLRGSADARSDVFALGLTLYELLTLRPLFDGRDRGRSRRDGQALPKSLQPRAINPAIPRDLEAVVLKCLVHQPEGRYASAAALAADLRRFLEDRPVRARRVSLREHLWRWCRRNPALSTTSALAAFLLVAVAVIAVVGYTRTRTAYAQTRTALGRAEANSQLALDVLDGIYRQLSPERVWIASDSDPAAQTCACIGIRTGDGSSSSLQRTAMRVQASPQTAALLDNFISCYDSLAKQGGNNRLVRLQSAVASRRVGDIRLCLGQIDRAEQEYSQAVEKLTALCDGPNADVETCTELARSYNEIGNVQSVKRQPARAYEFHQKALAVLDRFEADRRPPEEYRYELARTKYFLGSKVAAAPGDVRARQRNELATWAPSHAQSTGYWRSAIRILEELSKEHPAAPDYRLLLALCYRSSEAGTAPKKASKPAQGRQKAIRILEELAAEYPGVADYRYELMATYAWIPVGLFPWQGRTSVSAEGEQALRKALDESQRLVTQCPTVPHYGASESLILAKLATVCWSTRRTAQAEELFQKALETQAAVVERFPELSSYQRVFLEFLRLRLAQVTYERQAGAAKSDPVAIGACHGLLEECIDNLTELIKRPELAQDRLAWSSLPIAYDTLVSLLEGIGQREKAAEAKKHRRALPIPPKS